MYNKTLTELRLDSNLIGDEGARWFSEMYKLNPKIKLILSYNKITSDGARSLLKARKVHENIEFEVTGNMDINHKLTEELRTKY